MTLQSCPELRQKLGLLFLLDRAASAQARPWVRWWPSGTILKERLRCEQHLGMEGLGPHRARASPQRYKGELGVQSHLTYPAPPLN